MNFLINIAHASAGKKEAVEFMDKFREVILDPFIVLVASAAMLVFIYGCFEYVTRSNDPAGRDQGRKHIMWGIIGLVVIVSAVALLNIFLDTFEIKGTGGKGAFDCAHDPSCEFKID